MVEYKKSPIQQTTQRILKKDNPGLSLRGKNVRLFSILISLHGLAVFYNSIVRIYSGEYFKIGHLIFDRNYYYIGLLLGALLIFSGVGIYFQRKFGYYTTLFTYTIYILHGFISLIYIFVTDGLELVPSALMFILIIAFYILIRYIKSNKNWFDL